MSISLSWFVLITKNLGRLWLAYTELQGDFTRYNSYLLIPYNDVAAYGTNKCSVSEWASFDIDHPTFFGISVNWTYIYGAMLSQDKHEY